MRTPLSLALALSSPASAWAVPTLSQGPLVPDELAVFTVSGLDPGATVAFAGSTTGVGPGPCPPQLGGLCLDLRAPVLLGSTTANASGVANLQVRVPAALPVGTWVYTQAAVLAPAPATTYVVSARVVASAGGGLVISDVGSVATSTWTGVDLDSRSGTALALVDLDGDGRDDLLVGAELEGTGAVVGGAVFVAYGTTVAGAFDLSAAARFDGGAANDRLGQAVASAGDVDGDGYGDAIVGAMSDQLAIDGGSAHLLYGGPVREVGAASVYTMDASWHGDTQSARLGDGVGSGDLDGDGLSDLLIGHFGYGAQYPGAVYVEYGSPVRYAGNRAATGMDGLVGTTGDRIGFSDEAMATGDLDGDGADELLLGAWEGAAMNVYVAPGGQRVNGLVPVTLVPRITQASPSSQSFGSTVAVVGDVDGDGYRDLAIGDEGYDYGARAMGAVWLFAGGAGGLPAVSTPADAFAEILGVADGDNVGHRISAASDLVGDGVDDVAVAAWAWDEPFLDAGAVTVFEGGATLAGSFQFDDQGVRLQTDGGSRFLGADLATGDLDGDGLDDLVVSAQNAEGARGVTYLLRGGTL